MKSSLFIFSLCCGLVAAGARGQTNFTPKAPPRTYDARVQMHRVPLDLAMRERDEEKHFWLPKTGGNFGRPQMDESPAIAMPQDDGARKSGRDAAEEDDGNTLSAERKPADVRKILGVDDEDQMKRLQPQWSGLARDVMKNRAAAQKDARTRPGDGSERDRDKTFAKTDLPRDRDRRSYTSWLDDKQQDEADAKNRALLRGFDASGPTILAGDGPVKMFGDTAPELRNDGIAGLKDYSAQLEAQVVSRGPAFDARAVAAAPAAYRSDVLSGQAGIGPPSLRGGDAIFLPRVDAAIMAAPQAEPVFSPVASSVFSSPSPGAGPGGGLFTRDSIAPAQPAAISLPPMGPTDGFRKPTTLPW